MRVCYLPFLATLAFAGCTEVGSTDQRDMPFTEGIQQSAPTLEHVPGVTWREGTVNDFVSCSSGIMTSDASRRGAIIIRDWFSTAANIDACDRKNMALISNERMHQRIRYLTSLPYGRFGPSRCQRAALDLVVDVDQVANAIAARLLTLDDDCRNRQITKELEERRNLLTGHIGDIGQRSQEFLNQ